MPVNKDGKFVPWEETPWGQHCIAQGLKRSDVTFIFAPEYMYRHVDNFAMSNCVPDTLIMTSIIFEDEFKKDFPDQVWVTRVGVVHGKPMLQIKESEEDCFDRKAYAFLNWFAWKYPEFLDRGYDLNKQFLGYSHYHVAMLMEEVVKERLKSGKYVISPGEWCNPEDDPTDKEHYIEKPEVDPTKLPTEEELTAQWKEKFFKWVAEWKKRDKSLDEKSELAKKFATIPTTVVSDTMYEEWVRIVNAF